MSAENGELIIGVSHRADASVSQPGNNAQPEIVRPAEAGSSSSQPGETLAKTLSDVSVNMGTMASLLQTIVARQDSKPQKNWRHSHHDLSSADSESEDNDHEASGKRRREDDELRYCRGCKKRRSLRSNSFFEEFPRISLAKILLCIYFFLEDDSQKSASRKIGLTKEKTSQIYRKLEDVCSVDLEYNSIIPFAGPGIVVKCDESKFNHKAKNNRGRRAERDVWVFGIVTTEYTPCTGYFQVVKRRDAATLHPIIEKCIRPGTEVHTDDWGAYRNLDQRLNNVATHRVVNHSRYFVDPRTGIHTQEAESCWATLKLKQVMKRGIRRKDMQSYLDDRMWRQWRGGPRQQIMSNFLHALAAQCDNFSVF